MPDQGNQDGLKQTRDPMILIGRLLERLGQRRDEYLTVAAKQPRDSEYQISFTARAAETDVFIDDLEALQEIVQGRT